MMSRSNQHLGRVNQFIGRPKSAALGPQDIRALTMVVYIVALLGEHCNFEQVRAEHPGGSYQVCCLIVAINVVFSELASDFNAISQVSCTIPLRLCCKS